MAITGTPPIVIVGLSTVRPLPAAPLAGRAANLNLGTILTRRLMIRGTMMRSRSGREKAAVTEAFARDVLPMLERGDVSPVIDRVFPLEQIREAHELMESNQTFGKVVVAH